MKIAIKELKPNPFRDFTIYPIFPEWIEELKDSIKQTGYWNGFHARKKNGEYQIPYGHHRKQALEEMEGLDFKVEVQIENISDSLMRQRMFRENIRNEAQDSAVILHDIEVAKKFPSDWKGTSVDVPIGERWKRSGTLRTIYKISKFIGRSPVAIERVHRASKELSAKELAKIAPPTAIVIAKEIRKQKPSPRVREQIIQEAKESNIGPRTAKRRVSEIIIEEMGEQGASETKEIVVKEPEITELITNSIARGLAFSLLSIKKRLEKVAQTPLSQPDKQMLADFIKNKVIPGLQLFIEEVLKC